MLPFEDRYTRQRQLPEVGLAGQAKLEQSRVDLGTSACELAAAEYLRRAGVQVGRAAARVSDVPSAHAGLFEFAGPAAIGGGALLALAHIRDVLELPTAAGRPEV